MKGIARLVLAAWSAALLAAPQAARADVVENPPKSCPPGSVGETGHGGPYCALSYCEAGCKAGTSCKSTNLCVDKIDVGGRQYTAVVPNVVGTCPEGGTCAKGVCERHDVCVADKSPLSCGAAGGSVVLPCAAIAALLALARRKGSLRMDS